jgi:hypothetical protein
MTRISESLHVEVLGTTAVTRICAMAKQVFGPVSFADVGIDGFIEVCFDGAPTGFLAGVQIKSGPSYVGRDAFLLRADRDHYGYWLRCAFPVLGVVYDPKTDTARWVREVRSLDYKQSSWEQDHTREFLDETAAGPHRCSKACRGAGVGRRS